MYYKAHVSRLSERKVFTGNTVVICAAARENKAIEALIPESPPMSQFLEWLSSYLNTAQQGEGAITMKKKKKY